MRLAAMLRIKDQILTIDECMSKLSEIADEIIVVDNGSTDGTLQAYGKYPKIVKVLRTEGFDEGRDKVMILEEAKKSNPDWMLWIDADEIFENHFTRAVAEKYMRSRHDRIVFRMCNFWLSRERCRYDSEYYLYTLHPQRSMWRNMPSAYFRNIKIHNGDIMGIPGKPYISLYRLKHYGYADRKKVEEKLALYSRVDPKGSRDYSGTISPDLPFKTFRYYEFKNNLLNGVYIFLYKYACNSLWILLRIRLKMNKLFHTSK